MKEQKQFNSTLSEKQKARSPHESQQNKEEENNSVGIVSKILNYLECTQIYTLPKLKKLYRDSRKQPDHESSDESDDESTVDLDNDKEQKMNEKLGHKKRYSKFKKEGEENSYPDVEVVLKENEKFGEKSVELEKLEKKLLKREVHKYRKTVFGKSCWQEFKSWIFCESTPVYQYSGQLHTRTLPLQQYIRRLDISFNNQKDSGREHSDGFQNIFDYQGDLEGDFQKYDLKPAIKYSKNNKSKVKSKNMFGLKNEGHIAEALEKQEEEYEYIEEGQQGFNKKKKNKKISKSKALDPAQDQNIFDIDLDYEDLQKYTLPNKKTQDLQINKRGLNKKSKTSHQKATKQSTQTKSMQQGEDDDDGPKEREQKDYKYVEKNDELIISKDVKVNFHKRSEDNLDNIQELKLKEKTPVQDNVKEEKDNEKTKQQSIVDNSILEPQSTQVERNQQLKSEMLVTHSQPLKRNKKKLSEIRHYNKQSDDAQQDIFNIPLQNQNTEEMNQSLQLKSMSEKKEEKEQAMTVGFKKNKKNKRKLEVNYISKVKDVNEGEDELGDENFELQFEINDEGDH